MIIFMTYHIRPLCAQNLPTLCTKKSAHFVLQFKNKLALMAAQLREKLQPLVLDRVRETIKELGRGSYGVVIEVMVNGRKCAGKKLHDYLVMVG